MMNKDKSLVKQDENYKFGILNYIGRNTRGFIQKKEKIYYKNNHSENINALTWNYTGSKTNVKKTNIKQSTGGKTNVKKIKNK